MRKEARKKLNEWLVTFPSLAWLLVLFVVPTLLVFAITFRPVDPYGGIGSGWTLETLRSLGNPNYPAIVWRTVWLSALTTVLCMLFGVPCAFHMARVTPPWRRALLLLVIVPFWTSFLIRIFAWKVLLHPEGPVKSVLLWLHLAAADTQLLYRPEAVLLVMVYTFLPFAILPLYAAAEKFDFALLEAARDLGARPFQAFWRIFIPGIRRGLVTALLMVFIPALGSYVIPDIVGGPSSEMIGNKIAQRTFVDRNLPHASGLAALLALAVLVPLVLMWLQQRGRGETPSLVQEDA